MFGVCATPTSAHHVPSTCRDDAQTECVTRKVGDGVRWLTIKTWDWRSRINRVGVTTRQTANWFFSEVAQAALRYTLGSASILIGLTWIFGSDRRHSSAIFSIWNELGISWTLTGLWALISGLLIVLPMPWPSFRIVGYAMGFLFRFTFAGYALAAYFRSPITGITGFTDWGTLAVAHVVCGWSVIKARDTPRIADVQAAIKRRVDV